LTQHLAAWYESTYGVTEYEINAVKDDVLTRTSDERFLVPADLSRIRWGAALGTNLTRAYYYSPSIETRRMRPDIIPHVTGGVAFNLSKMEIFKPLAPIELVPTEELSAKCTLGGSAAAPAYVLASLSREPLTARPAGDIRCIRCTGSTTLTAGSWTSVKITPDISLEAGEYSLIGLLGISTGALAVRAIITGQVWRPGAPALAGSESAVKDAHLDPLWAVQDYEMGRFTHMTVPEIQFLSNSADTSEVVYLYVVKTA